MREQDTFAYTYSSKEQAEVKRIRNKYTPHPQSPAESKLERLRRLDAGVTKKASAVAVILGIVSALVFGAGMCCCLVWSEFFIGIAVGLIGIIGLALAYPLYSAVVRRERKKIAPEILQLSDELMQ